MNHNHWPEWIIVLRDDIFPGGFLSRPSPRRMQYVAAAKGGVRQLKLPRFPGDVTEVYIIAEASAVESRCRPGHLPPPA